MLCGSRRPAFFGKRKASGWGSADSESMTVQATVPRGTDRGPVLESGSVMALSAMSRQRRLSASPRRQPVSRSKRIAATASGHCDSWDSRARPSRCSSSISRNRAIYRLEFFDAETGVGAALAQPPFLGSKHHRSQDLESTVGGAGLVLARGVEPLGHALWADPVQKLAAEGWENTGLEIDSNGLAPRGLPVRVAAQAR